MNNSLKCEKCGEIFILGQDAISMTSEETMAMMPFRIGQMPKSLMVAHIKDKSNWTLLEESKSTIMRLGPDRGWICNICHFTNRWYLSS